MKAVDRAISWHSFTLFLSNLPAKQFGMSTLGKYLSVGVNVATTDDTLEISNGQNSVTFSSSSSIFFHFYSKNQIRPITDLLSSFCLQPRIASTVSCFMGSIHLKHIIFKHYFKLLILKFWKLPKISKYNHSKLPTM